MKGLYGLILFSFFSFSFFLGFAQTNGDYQSRQSGNWNTVTTWQVYNSGWQNLEDGAAGSYQNIIPSSIAGLITITGGHAVTISDSRTASNIALPNTNGTNLTITSTGQLTLSGNLTFNGPSRPKVNVGGVLQFNDGSSIANAGTQNLIIQNGGIYRLNYSSGGTIYNGDFQPGSTLEFTGYTSSSLVAPSLQVSPKSFHNVIWNCTNQGGDISLGGILSTINGDLIVNSTSSNDWYLYLSNLSNISVIGNLSINGSSIVYVSNGGSSVNLNVGQNLTVNTSSSLGELILAGGSGAVILTVGGNLNLNSANSKINLTELSGSGTLTVNGSIAISNGAIRKTGGGDGALNINEDFSLSSGQLSNIGGGIYSVSFGGSTAHSYSYVGTPINTKIDFTVPNGETLDFVGESAITGSGNFTLSAGGTIRINSPVGLTIGSSSTSNIRNTGSRDYQANGNIIYNGTTQNLGNEWSATGALNGKAVNLEITNGAIVTNNNTGSTSLVGTLSLTNGRLNIGNTNTLVIQGVYNSTSNGVIGGYVDGGGIGTSNLTFSGSGAVGSLIFAPSTQSLNNLTIARAGTVVLGSNLTVNGILALTNGNLDFSGYTLALNGSAITGSNGLVSSNTSSNLTIGGSTYSGAVPFSGSGNQLNNLTFSTTSPGGSFTWDSDVAVNGTLFLTAGTVTHTGGLSMATNATIQKSGGSFTGESPNAATNYNVMYQSSSGPSGKELPSSSSALKNLTMNGGSIALSSDITVNGNVVLTSGTLNAVSHSITLAGASSTWSKGSGTFNVGTGTVIISGNASIVTSSTAPNFNNLTTLTGSTLTMPSGDININGNLQLNASSVFNANGGTIIFNGTGNQVIAGAGKTFSNITVNKTGGNVQLQSSVNLTGLLNVLTSTSIQSNGNLTLISSSDGTTGNASIGKLPSGASIAGDVAVQRRMSAEGRVYRDISSSVQSATVQQIMSSGISVTGFTGSSYPCSGCTTNNPSMYFYDETVPGVQANGKTPITSASNTLAVGRGYNLLVRNELGAVTMSLTGAINSGDLSLPVTYTATSGGATEDGWNLVGNPYPSTIDWDAISGWTKTNIQGNTIYIWDAGANGYKTWNGSVGSLPNGRIAQGQAFYIKVSAGSPALSITEDAKINTTGAFYREKTEKIHSLEIILKSDSSEDRAYLQKVDGGVMSFDQLDGAKLPQEGLSIASLTADNQNVAINVIGEIPSSGQIRLRTSNLKTGTYTIALKLVGDFEESKVFIQDNYTGNVVSANEPFTFSVDEREPVSLHSNRFVLVFGELLVTGIEQSVSRELFIYPNPVTDIVQVKIKSQSQPICEILTGVGVTVGEMDWSKESEDEAWSGKFEMSAFSSGVYLARIKFDNSVRVIKFIKN